MVGKQAVCQQCRGACGEWKKEKRVDSRGKVTTEETWIQCRRCNGTGQER
jgi:hypothetical protein